MKAFAYVNAANEKEAVAALASGGMDARTTGPDRKYLPLAGGMDLLARMKDYTHQPDVLVNVKNLDATIRQTPDGGLRIGSAVKLIAVIRNDLIAKNYPAFTTPAAEVGTPQYGTRNRRWQPQPTPPLLVLQERGIQLPQEERLPLLLR